MFDSVAFDVVIGLIFIFLLYSLLVTIIAEGFSTLFNIRGRILLKSIERMLTDDVSTKPGYNWKQHFLRNIMDSFLLRRSIHFKNSLAERFYEYPAIKYLSQHILHKCPPYISTPNFSTSLIEILRRKGTASTIMEEIANGLHSPALAKSPETKKQLEDLINKANGDVNVFKKNLELWFDETMMRASGWYKINIQSVQLAIGFLLALAFNVNTFQIARILSRDETARNNMVKMATDPSRLKAYDTIIKQTEKEKQTSNAIEAIDSAHQKAATPSPVPVDTFYINTYKRLQKESQAVTAILGNGWGLRDSLTADTCLIADANIIRIVCSALPDHAKGVHRLDEIGKASTKKLITSIDYFTELDSVKINSASSAQSLPAEIIVYGKAPLSMLSKLAIVIRSLGNGFNFVGFLITALALSLGAPFWFDLLNKFVAIKGAGKNPDATKADVEKKSDEKKFPETDQTVNSLGHQLSEHVMKDPVRYAIAMHSVSLKSIPGVIAINKDFVRNANKKIPCAEIVVQKNCNQDLLPKTLQVSFNGQPVTVPVEIVMDGVGNFHTGYGDSSIHGLRNDSTRDNWGTATGLAKLQRTKEAVIVSCAHVLQGNNPLNEVTTSTKIIEYPGEKVIGKLLYHYRSNAFDIGWASTSENKTTIDSDYVKSLTTLKKPRIVTEDDATAELPIKMKGVASGDVSGILWNNCVEYEFFYESERIKMFNLLKLARRNENLDLVTLSKPGDSGSLITDERDNPIGIVIGGTSEFTYALKLADIFERFTDITYF